MDDNRLLIAFYGPILELLLELQRRMAGAPLDVVLQLALSSCMEMYGRPVVISGMGKAPDELVDWDITLLHLLGHYRGVCLNSELEPCAPPTPPTLQ